MRKCLPSPAPEKNHKTEKNRAGSDANVTEDVYNKDNKTKNRRSTGAGSEHIRVLIQNKNPELKEMRV